MREGLKDDRYNLRVPPPEPLVPRARRLGVTERMRADGRVATALDRRSLARAIDALRADSVQAVAVCYLHAYRDPRPEKLTRAARRLRLALVRNPPADQGIRARVHDRGQRVRRPDPLRVPGAAGSTAGGGRLPRAGAGHAVARRRGPDRRGGAAGRGGRAVGA